jgi:hypothetical protein
MKIKTAANRKRATSEGFVLFFPIQVITNQVSCQEQSEIIPSFLNPNYLSRLSSQKAYTPRCASLGAKFLWQN